MSVQNHNGVADVYVYNRVNHITDLGSLTFTGAQGNAFSAIDWFTPPRALSAEGAA